jgi:capsular exopolysaccharide synthesis family protein
MAMSPSAPRTATSLLWHPTDYLRVLYKRRWVAIPGFLLIFLSGTVNSIRTVPIYEARTQLLIEKEARRATTINTVLQEQDSWYADDFYPTQQRILQSRALAERAAMELQKDAKPEKVPAGPRYTLSVGSVVGAVQSGISSLMSSGPNVDAGPMTAQQEHDANWRRTVDSVQGGLTVVPIRASRLFDLRFRSPDPDFAQRAANAFAKAYSDQTIDLRAGASGEATKFLKEQLEDQKAKVLASQQALQTYRAKNNAAAVDDRQNVTIQRLTALTANVTQAKIELVDREARFRQLQGLRTSNETLESLPEVVGNEYIQSVKARIDQLSEEETRLMAQNFGPEWPALVQVRQSMATQRKLLAGEIEKIASSIEAEHQSAQAKVTNLEQQVAREQGAAMSIDQKAVEYSALEREASSAQTLYESLLQSVSQSTMAGDFKGTNVRVVDRAEFPEWPVLPQSRRDITMAALGGLVLALGLAFGFEYFDSRIKSPDEVKAFLGLPFLGMIPSVTTKDPNGEAPMLSPDVPPSFAEAIRAVRTAVLFSSADEGARSVIVTSTGPSEGKTLISSSLAISLAQAGQRTLVVDADMRRPRLHEALGRSQEPGLSNVLVGEASLADAARQTQEKNLWVLSAGHIPPNPAELLGSRKFDELMADLKRRFDWIVIDAPPVMPVTDAAVLAHGSGGVLFVIGSEMTPRQSATAAVEQLRGASAKFIGVVLNRVNVHRHGYYYSPYYRKEYNKYYQRSANRA